MILVCVWIMVVGVLTIYTQLQCYLYCSLSLFLRLLQRKSELWAQYCMPGLYISLIVYDEELTILIDLF